MIFFKSYSFVFLIVLLITNTKAQSVSENKNEIRTFDENRINWLKKNAISVRSVQSSDEDFSDLQPLKNALKDAKVVLLGEQTHGDGTTFLAKTRLIKFLRQEMGFDVLAFESSFYTCSKAGESLRNGEDAFAVFQRCIQSVVAKRASPTLNRVFE